MLRSIARHLAAAVAAALLTASAAGGVEGYLLFQANQSADPPGVMIILLAVMYAVYGLYLAVPAAAVVGIFAGVRARSSGRAQARSSAGAEAGGAGDGIRGRPLFGRYLLFFLAAYGVLWTAGFFYQRNGSDFFTARGLLIAAGFAAAVVMVAVVLGRLLRGLERRPGIFMSSVVGLWAALMVFLVAEGLQRPEPVSGALAKKPTPDKPSVLYVLVDALRADHLGCYGYERDTSASVNALAADGVLFENCFAQSSWTLPSVASMLTSTPPPRHGAVDVGRRVDPGMAVFPGRMAGHGYRTASFSANPLVSHTFGFHQEVEHYRSSTRSLARETGIRETWLGQVHKMLWKVTQPKGAERARGRRQAGAAAGLIFGVYNKTYDQVLKLGIALRSELESMGEDAASLNAEFLRWLDGLDGARFAAYMHFMEPHAPYDPDPPFDAIFPRDYSGEPVTRPPRRVEDAEEGAPRFPPLEAGAFADLVARYDGEIAQFSHSFADLAAELKQRGLYDDLLIVFVADHGDEFYDHEAWGHCHTVYNELIHVPLIVKFPGNAHAGTRARQPCRAIDIVPSVLDFLKLPPWEQAEGESFLYVLAGDGAATAGDMWSAISCTAAGGKNVRSYIGGQYKLICDPQAAEAWQLFDMAADPGERHSLAQEKPELLEELKAKLEDAYARYRHLDGRAAEAEMDPETEEQLRRLGYL